MRDIGYVTLENLIEFLCKYKYSTIEIIADKCGVGEKAVKAWRKGKHSPQSSRYLVIKKGIKELFLDAEKKYKGKNIQQELIEYCGISGEGYSDLNSLVDILLDSAISNLKKTDISEGTDSTLTSTENVFLGKFIHFCIEEGSYTIGSLASHFGVPRSTIQNWANGKTDGLEKECSDFSSKCEKLISVFLDDTTDSVALKKFFSIPTDQFFWRDLLEEHLSLAITSGNEAYLKIPEMSEMEKVAQRKFKEAMGIIKGKTPNIYLMSKKESEKAPFLSFQERHAMCRELVMVNFAGTSIFAGSDISKVYDETIEGRLWFNHELREGKIKLKAILNNPRSYAGMDAAYHKMNPKMDAEVVDELAAKQKIIAKNILFLIDFKKKYQKAKVELWLTDVVLPYGVMWCKSTGSFGEVMKVDLYSALPEYKSEMTGDDERISFYLIGGDKKTENVSRYIKDSVQYIEKNSVQFTGPDFDWMIAEKRGLPPKTIVHRGRYGKQNTEHNINGYWACIKNGYPMEVDILELADGTLLVGRDETLVNRKTPQEGKKLSAMTLKELRSLDDGEWGYEKAGADIELPFRLSELMTLKEFLGMVNGAVPLLIELKLPAGKTPEENIKPANELVAKLMSDIQYYQGKYAVHAANPWVLKALHERDCTIPCGQITWEFTGWGGKLPDYYLDYHRNVTFSDVFQPDFISQKLTELIPNSELKNEQRAQRIQKLKNLSIEKQIPVIAWAGADDSSAFQNRWSIEWIKNYVLEAKHDP